MKVFIIEFKNRYNSKAYLEAESKIEAIKWFAENMPAKSRIIKIEEGENKGLLNIKEILKD